ncbi:hypothetical protein EJB05_41882, partial [Eragrostis curvula]
MGTSFSSNLTEASSAVHLFKINGYSATKAMGKWDSLPSKRLAVGGYEWQVHYTPSRDSDWHYWIAFKLVLLGAPRRTDVKASLKCRLLVAHPFSSSDPRHGQLNCSSPSSMGGVFSSNLTEAARAVHMFKINGYSATRAMGRTDSLPSKRLAVGGYDWEVHYTPSQVAAGDGSYLIAFKLVILGAPRRGDVKASLNRIISSVVSRLLSAVCSVKGMFQLPRRILLYRCRTFGSGVESNIP